MVSRQAAHAQGQARVSVAAIGAALPLIPPELRNSPQFVHEGLSRRLGRPVVVKVETVNPLGSFKGRGAWLAVAGLVAEDRLGPEREVIAASSGNFGLAVAYAARALDVPAVIYAAQAANARKIERIRALDARVVLEGRDFDAAREASQRYAQRSGGLLLVDAEEPRITNGAGTIAVELTGAVARGELPPLGAAYVPVGNGALIVGMGMWFRHASPKTRVVGVQAEGAPSMTLSWRAGRPIETEAADTYAGGIATRVPVPEALELMAEVVDDMLLVSDDTLRTAQAELTEALGITVEGSAAASWAGALAVPPAEGAALVVVTGSNAEVD
jgi:threonine dehydratase